MKFIVDEQLPAGLALWIASQGHDALHVSELGLKSGTDREIREAAFVSGAIVVTKDQDFIRISRQADRVLWVRGGNLPRSALMARFAASWFKALTALESGDLIVEINLRV